MSKYNYGTSKKEALKYISFWLVLVLVFVHMIVNQPDRIQTEMLAKFIVYSGLFFSISFTLASMHLLFLKCISYNCTITLSDYSIRAPSNIKFFREVEYLYRDIVNYDELIKLSDERVFYIRFKNSKSIYINAILFDTYVDYKIFLSDFKDRIRAGKNWEIE